MWRIGLTGGIGSGKSTVAGLLVTCGASLIDTDAIARNLTEPGGAAIPALKTRFGPDIVDSTGALNRVAMRSLAFSNPSAKQDLEGILHPLIRERVEQQTLTCTTPVVVLDIPLLVESGRWRDRVDQVWVVDCQEETQMTRVLQRPGWTEATARAVVKQQAKRARRNLCADVLLYNDGIDLIQLAQHVNRLWAELIDTLKPAS